jgi:hypothetical protein
MVRSSFTVPLLVLALVALVAGCSSSPPPAGDGCGPFGAYVDAFPVPVSDDTSVFDDVDDDALVVPFGAGFTFPFYGGDYDEVYVNTNGGMTFGAGFDSYDVSAADVEAPGIAIFWGDMDAGEYAGETRANQLRWRQSAACFQVAYQQLQDNDSETWVNSATITLYDTGKIVVEYGTVGSEDILVGVFDGTHVDDSYPALGASFDMSASGTGIILFDYWDAGPDHDGGELTNATITYLP